MGMGVLLSLPPALPFLRANSLPLARSLRDRGAALAADLAASPADDLARAVDREMRRRLDRFLTGIERYRRHPYRRDLDDPPVAWREGRTRLLDHGGPADGPVVLFVPSLVNRGYILDLSARKSLVRDLAARGLRVFLLDWGAPGPMERGFTLTDVIDGRLVRALAAVSRAAGGRRITIAGYCMGGLLALAAATARPDLVERFVALATPWDFHADDPAGAARIAALLPGFEPILRLLGELPVDGIQSLFATLDPLLALKKFSRFARLDPDGAEAEEFVALEDWLNDGVTLPAAVARECLEGWYGANTPGRGEWRVGGHRIDPAALSLPALVVVPARDRIVPPASARALGERIPGAEIRTPPLGHIGMIVSGAAREKVWDPLADWLLSR
jgi:polyhydroxyalkanoate synthase